MTNRNPEFLPYGRHAIDDDDVAAVAAALRSGALTNGPAAGQFEEALAAATGAKEAVVCSSGTAALHLAAAGLGVGAGDSVIVPALTFLATANCARYAGADVVFADVNPSSGLMEPVHVEAAIDRAPAQTVKAVIPVHLNGQCCDLEGIGAVARARGAVVIEDACHALGGTYPGSAEATVGSCTQSDAACFSFHPVKTIAMGEGGAITTNDARLAATLRRLRNHGMVRMPDPPYSPGLALSPDGSPNPWYYEMPELGWNYRASDIHCALGLSQLRKLPAFAARRAELAARYDSAIKPLAPAVGPIARTGGRVAWHLYVVHIDFAAIGKSRAEVMKALEAEGIGTQVHYLPVHLQPYYQKLYGRRQLPGAEAYYNSCLSLPLFPSMKDADVDRVVAALKRVIER